LHIKRREDVDLPISQRRQSQLPTWVGFGFGLASKGEIMVVEWQIGEQSSEYDWKLTAMNNELKKPMNSSAIIYFKD